ncbi:hypothetical protein F3Y22_tig00112205pilonHSYRG00064 [Hibiscus syriacus]|uniref:Uncharacterized protein n=1 Tax=Hibiscus syriacus TaxID=106335 RepID=A0A6A2Y3G4_HIBSY|nr:hypothetical protein F3Y22_tig00112205pilonHSYRG00064 [Hibiscus syriacus]
MDRMIMTYRCLKYSVLKKGSKRLRPVPLMALLDCKHSSSCESCWMIQSNLFTSRFLQNAPHGDLVFQTLAVNYWGGPLVVKATDAGYQRAEGTSPSESASLDISDHVFDIDGSG